MSKRAWDRKKAQRARRAYINSNPTLSVMAKSILNGRILLWSARHHCKQYLLDSVKQIWKDDNP